MLKLMVWAMKQQSAGGRLFLFENPPTSAIWKEPEMEEVYHSPDVCSDIGDMRQRGAIGQRYGLPMFEKMRWVSDRLRALRACAPRCPGGHQRERVEGKSTKPSQERTESLARPILTELREMIARGRNPRRFAMRKLNPLAAKNWSLTVSAATEQEPPGSHVNPFEVFYQDASHDAAEWRRLLEQMTDVMSRRAAPSWEPTAVFPTRKSAQALARWELMRVQVALVPREKHKEMLTVKLYVMHSRLDENMCSSLCC
jgi:hypothetical protein